MIQSIDYAAIAVPLTLALVAGLVLLLDAFLPQRTGAGVIGYVTLAGVVAALAILAVQGAQGVTRRTFCVPVSLGGGGGGADCSFVLDRFALIFGAVVLAAGVVVVLLSMAELTGGRSPAGEWYFLLLCTFAGAVTLPASRDLIMLVVALELVSLPVFALTAMRRYDGRGSEAALKLFLVSVISTAIMLFGVSLLYGLTGSVFLDKLAAGLTAAADTTSAGAAQVAGASDALIAASSTGATGAYGSTLTLTYAGSGGAVASVAVVLVLAGFAFKIAAVPFHFWAGDVYQGAPVPVAALLSVISKAAGFAGLILVLTVGLAGRADIWGPAVAILSALTMTAGNVLAMRQRNAVRLLAWSSVAQSGYILAPLAVTAGGDAFAASVTASVAYLVFYAAMNIGAFAVVMLISRAGVSGTADGEIDGYRGLAFQRPGAAIALGFFLVCLAGLPPGLAGLFAKVVVFRQIIDGGVGWLAVVMAINTVIGLYYYLAWTARLFTPVAGAASRARSGPVAVAIGVALLITLAFSVAPQVVLSAVG